MYETGRRFIDEEIGVLEYCLITCVQSLRDSGCRFPERNALGVLLTELFRLQSEGC
jgi:hypothetical protein